MICKIFCLLVCGIIVILTGIQAAYNDSVCSFETFNCGPIPPSFKESFIMKLESVDFTTRITSWEEEYFDAPNLLAKLKIVDRGIEIHIIFDYHLEEVITYQVIHPGAPAEKDPAAIRTCKAMNMDDSPLKDLYGYRYEHRDTKRTRMYNSHQVFHFGGDYKYAFVENVTLKNREIPTVQYHGCVYDEFSDSTMDKNFFWSKEEVIIASGEDTMPVKINTFGTQTIYPNEDGVSALNSFNFTENIVWYEGNPVFDPETFQIPRGMYCEDLRTETTMPEFPSAFSARLEMATIKYDMDGNLRDIGFVSNYELWYDAIQNLVRTDYVPAVDELDLFLAFGETPVTGIFDMNQGVVYYISKVSGNCIPFEIPSDSPFIASGFKRKLVSPEEIFGFNDDMQYKGKNTAREILCDVWVGRTKNDENETKLIELYVSTEGWHTQSQEAEDYDVPVRITETVFESIDDVQYEIVTESNIFNFKAEEPLLSVFDITNCMVNQNHLFLSFAIEKTFNKVIVEKQMEFLEIVRQAIADYSSIGSVLLVQNVELFISPINGKMRINFVLMDQPILYGKTKKQPGTSLNSAFINLKSAINSGSFQISFVIDPMEGAEIIRPAPNSLIKLFQNSEPSVEQTIMDDDILQGGIDVMDDDILQGGIDILDDPEFDQQDADKPQSIEQNADNIKYIQGYSSGLLAGVGIIMLIAGIAIGIGLMLLYFKKYGGTSTDSTILMKERTT